MITVRTPKSIMETYHCDFDTAERYCDLRDEGYSVYQAKLMAGLCDPTADSEPEVTSTP